MLYKNDWGETMGLAEKLKICPGITAVIGGGGKTTLLRTLGEELAKKKRVLLCTSTKILPFSEVPCAKNNMELQRLMEHGIHLICAGRELPESGKLTAPETPFAQLAEWFDYVLVEADGSARRPLKAHASHEPVIPAETDQTICVVGASGFGQPIADAVHRPELFARLAGASVEDDVTAEMTALVLKAEALHQRVYINQVETLSDLIEAKTLAALLDCPVWAGSMQRGEYFKC